MKYKVNGNLWVTVKFLRVLAVLVAMLGLQHAAHAQDAGVVPGGAALAAEDAADPALAPDTTVAMGPFTHTCTKRPCYAAFILTGDILDAHPRKAAEAIAAWADAKPDGYFLYINSTGGSYDAAKKLYRLLATLPAPLYCLGDDNVMSAAFMVFQACKVRAVTPTTTLMTHEVKYSVTAGAVMTSDEMMTASNDLRVATDVYATYTASRLKMSKAAFLRRIHHGDWTMSVADAISIGAADLIFAGGPSEYFKKLIGE